MRKAFVYGVVGLFVLSSTQISGYSQDLAKSAKLNAKPSIEQIIPASKQSDNDAKTQFDLRNDVSIFAVRNFMKDYNSVADAKCSKLPHGYSVVSFTVDSIRS